jgi:hypothetical protein
MKGRFMTISLIDLYNHIAAQPWSMFDTDATSFDDFDQALLSAINKALIEIWTSYPFEFRLDSKIIFLQSALQHYPIPSGVIKQKETSNGIKYSVKLNNKYLDLIEDERLLTSKTGRPTAFYVDNNSLSFYPQPDALYKVKIDFYKLAIGYDVNGNPIYKLSNVDDYIDIPEQYEQLFLNALSSKVMMYSLVDISDDNYTGYNIQFEKAYKLLIKSLGGRKKQRKMCW